MKPLKNLVSDFKNAIDAYNKLDRDIPRLMGNIAVKQTKENINNQIDIEGISFIEREEKTNIAYDKRYGVKGSVYNSSNLILKQNRNLYNAIKYIIEGSKKVLIGLNLTTVPYAQAHNEGLGYQKKRQYLGWNEKLKLAIEKEIKKRRNNIFKKFKK